MVEALSTDKTYKYNSMQLLVHRYCRIVINYPNHTSRVVPSQIIRPDISISGRIIWPYPNLAEDPKRSQCASPRCGPDYWPEFSSCGRIIWPCSILAKDLTSLRWASPSFHLKRTKLREYILVSPASTLQVSCAFTCIIFTSCCMLACNLQGNSPSCT
jgi:hypothetical protein